MVAGLEAAHGLDPALALGFLAGEIGARLWVDPAARDSDEVQGTVELAVAATVEAVTVASPGGSSAAGLISRVRSATRISR